MFWAAGEHWGLDFTGAVVDSKFTGVPAAIDRIPNTFGEVFAAGITYVDADALEVSVRLRHFGDAPIVEDGSLRQRSSTLINAVVNYTFKHWQVGVDLLNVFNARDSDIEYFFESQLANEAVPVEGILFHPVLPRTVRAHLRMYFG